MNCNKIKEALKTATKEIKEAVLEKSEKMTAEEKLKYIKEHPEMSSEQIQEFLKGDNLEDLIRKAEDGFEKIKEGVNKNLIDPLAETLEKVKKDPDVVKLREVLNMESSLNDIVGGFKDFGKALWKKF